ncbi:MAG: hypothetical protein IK100_10440 [Muribaculaceae bacterium]|nr:hypothetical protein [Muribaculaceae bacterium]
MRIKYKVTFVFQMLCLLIVVLLLGSMILVDLYNDDRKYERKKPYSQIFSRNYVEYKVLNTSAENFVGELARKIESDSMACYGYQKISYASVGYKNELKKVYEINYYNLGKNHSGPKEYDITFLIPYNTESIHLCGNFFKPGVDKEIHYKEYYNKIKYKVSVIDSKPVTLLLMRGEDFDEQKLLDDLHCYFENHYLKSICKYEKRSFLNNYFFWVKWSFYHFYYLYFWWVTISLIIYLSERYIKKKNQHVKECQNSR